MATQRTISGAHVKIYINGTVYNECQQVSINTEYGEEPVYGIDSVFPQEIKITRVSVSGTISGLRIGNSNGLQGYNIRPGIRDSHFAPYISIRVVDNRTEEDIMFVPYAKVISESIDVSAKGVMRNNFSFTGLQPLQPLDRAK